MINLTKSYNINVININIERSITENKNNHNTNYIETLQKNDEKNCNIIKSLKDQLKAKNQEINELKRKMQMLNETKQIEDTLRLLANKLSSEFGTVIQGADLYYDMMLTEDASNHFNVPNNIICCDIQSNEDIKLNMDIQQICKEEMPKFQSMFNYSDTDNSNKMHKNTKLNPDAVDFIPINSAHEQKAVNHDNKIQIVDQQRNRNRNTQLMRQNNFQMNHECIHYKAIETITNGNGTLLRNLQLQVAMKNSNNTCSNCMSKQQRKYMKNKRKKEKQRIKKQYEYSFPKLCNQSSYDPPPKYRAKKNVFISDIIQQTIATLMGADKITWLKYIDKCFAMQQKEYDSIDKNKIAFNFDLYDEKQQQKCYCIIEKQESKNYKFKMIDKLFFLEDIKQINNDIIIAQSSRAMLMPQLQRKYDITNLLKSKYTKLIKIKWFDICVFRRKDKDYNRKRIVLRLENEYMKQLMLDLHNCITNKELIPIIMFNNGNGNYWIEWVLIVEIIDNMSIGITFKYNLSNGYLKISGIHTDKLLLLEQHYLVNPHHIHECHCFDNWKISCITDIDICGDLNDVNNKINGYKQRYESLKAFIYRCIHKDDFKTLKHEACFLMNPGSRNKSICASISPNYTRSPPITISPLHISNIRSRNINDSPIEQSYNTLCTTPTNSILILDQMESNNKC